MCVNNRSHWSIMSFLSSSYYHYLYVSVSSSLDTGLRRWTRKKNRNIFVVCVPNRLPVLGMASLFDWRMASILLRRSVVPIKLHVLCIIYIRIWKWNNKYWLMKYDWSTTMESVVFIILKSIETLHNIKPTYYRYSIIFIKN